MSTLTTTASYDDLTAWCTDDLSTSRSGPPPRRKSPTPRRRSPSVSAKQNLKKLKRTEKRTYNFNTIVHKYNAKFLPRTTTLINSFAFETNNRAQDFQKNCQRILPVRFKGKLNKLLTNCDKWQTRKVTLENNTLKYSATLFGNYTIDLKDTVVQKRNGIGHLLFRFPKYFDVVDDMLDVLGIASFPNLFLAKNQTLKNIFTIEEKTGRVHYFQAETKEKRNEWVSMLVQAREHENEYTDCDLEIVDDRDDEFVMINN